MSPRLLAGEIPIAVARQHWSTVAPAFAGGLIVIALGLTGLGVAPGVINGHSLTDTKRVLGIALLVGVLGVVGFRYLQWRSNLYMLTNHRIVVSRGILSRVTESIALDRVQDTAIRQSLGARMIGRGDLEIESAGRDGVEVLRRIPNPEGFYNAVMQATEAHRIGGGAMAAPPAATPSV